MPPPVKGPSSPRRLERRRLCHMQYTTEPPSVFAVGARISTRILWVRSRRPSSPTIQGVGGAPALLGGRGPAEPGESCWWAAPPARAVRRGASRHRSEATPKYSEATPNLLRSALGRRATPAHPGAEGKTAGGRRPRRVPCGAGRPGTAPKLLRNTPKLLRTYSEATPKYSEATPKTYGSE